MNFDHQQDDTPGFLKTLLAISGTVLIAGLVILCVLLSAGCGTTTGIDHQGNLEILIPYRHLADPSEK